MCDGSALRVNGDACRWVLHKTGVSPSLDLQRPGTGWHVTNCCSGSEVHVSVCPYTRHRRIDKGTWTCVVFHSEVQQFYCGSTQHRVKLRNNAGLRDLCSVYFDMLRKITCWQIIFSLLSFVYIIKETNVEERVRKEQKKETERRSEYWNRNKTEMDCDIS